MKIYKYELELADFQEIEVPSGFIPLHVGEDVYKNLCIWGMFDNRASSSSSSSLVVSVVGTGHEFKIGGLGVTGLEYFGTVTMSSGLVWHVFLEGK